METSQTQNSFYPPFCSNPAEVVPGISANKLLELYGLLVT
jgi:hypothetical protein